MFNTGSIDSLMCYNVFNELNHPKSIALAIFLLDYQVDNIIMLVIYIIIPSSYNSRITLHPTLFT